LFTAIVVIKKSHQHSHERESKSRMKFAFALLTLLELCLLASSVVGHGQLRGYFVGVADTVKQARNQKLLTEEGHSSSSVEGVTDHQKINSPTNGALFPGTEEVITPETDVSNNFFNCNKGVISGDLTDDDGMPLQGVTIKLLDDKDVVIATTMTNANGDYLFMDIPPGDYTVEETNPADDPTNISDDDETPDGDTADNIAGIKADNVWSLVK
jgi:SdrD B-like domain